MARTLTTALKNELLSNEIQPVHLLTIGFGTPVNLTDNSFDLTSSISGSSNAAIAGALGVGVSAHHSSFGFYNQNDVLIANTAFNLKLTWTGS